MKAFINKHINIIVVLAVLVIAAAVAIGITLSGMKNGDYDYIMLDTPAQIELVVNKKKQVLYSRAKNDYGTYILLQDDYVGEKLESATKGIIDYSCKMGIIDVDADEKGNNCVKVTVVSGLTNSLELNVYKTIFKYFSKNEIFCVILENEKDMQVINEAKKLEISSPDKAELINTIMDSKDITLKKLKSHTEEELIDMIIEIMENTKLDKLKKDASDELLNSNKSKFEEHIKDVSDKSNSVFGTKYDKYLKSRSKDFELHFKEIRQSEA